MYKLSSFNRATVLGCVELIAKLATNNENLNLFEASPERFFCKLVGNFISFYMIIIFVIFLLFLLLLLLLLLMLFVVVYFQSISS